MSLPQPVYVVQQKSTLVAYLLWFFFGQLGAHKLYLRQPLQFIIYLGLATFGYLLTVFTVFGGLFFLIPLGILLFVDIFIIPGRVMKINSNQ